MGDDTTQRVSSVRGKSNSTTAVHLCVYYFTTKDMIGHDYIRHQINKAATSMTWMMT